MNLRQVELFLAVVETGGFTTAAERLGIAQPAVSTSVRKLEEDLGVRLLERGARRVTPTAEGRAFLQHARAILAQVAASRREMAALRTLETGQLSIGAPPMVAGYLLPSVIDAFLAERPGIRLTVVQAGAEQIGARVLRGELDLGIVADWRTPDGLATRLLEHHPMVACVAASSPLARRRRLAWSELLDQPLILFPHGYHQRSRVDDAAARLGRTPEVVVEAEAVPLIAALVRRGHGVATLLAAAAHSLPGLRAVPLPSEATVPVAVCRRSRAPASAAVEAFQALLVASVEERAPARGGRPRRPRPSA